MASQAPLRRYTAYLALIIIAGLGTFTLWAGVDHATGITSNANFCGSCHSMQVMKETFLDDKHADVALCSDCHLPQDSFLNHYLTKAQHGFRDVIAEHLGDTEAKDWLLNLEHAQKFVFKSGCLQCHTVTNVHTGMRDAHQLYFSDDSFHCVSCHQVGHADLRRRLTEMR